MITAKEAKSRYADNIIGRIAKEIEKSCFEKTVWSRSVPKDHVPKITEAFEGHGYTVSRANPLELGGFVNIKISWQNPQSANPSIVTKYRKEGTDAKSE